LNRQLDLFIAEAREKVGLAVVPQDFPKRDVPLLRLG
jgi:hypothetical protein